MGYFEKFQPHAELKKKGDYWRLSLLLCLKKNQKVYDNGFKYDRAKKTITLDIRVSDSRVPGQKKLSGRARRFTYNLARYDIFSGYKRFKQTDSSFDRLKVSVHDSHFNAKLRKWEYKPAHAGHIVIIHPG